MSGERDETRIVRSWLERGVTELPDRVLDAVLDQIPTTPQRRATRWQAQRFPFMTNRTVQLGLAAAAVIAVVLLGATLLPRTNFGGPGPGSTPTSSATVAGRLTGDHLPAGRYRVDPSLPMEVTVGLPAGWAGNDWVAIGPKDNQPPDGMAIRFFQVANMPKKPNSGTNLMDPPLGPTVDDLVEAIVNQPAWNASTPTETTIDGYAGKHVTITIPPGAKFDSQGNFYLFDGIWGWAIGQTFEIYAVDVNGQRLVIDAFHYPGTSEDDIAAEQAAIASVQIGPKR